MSITIAAIHDAFSKIIDPNTGTKLIFCSKITNIQINNVHVTFDIELGYPAYSQIDVIQSIVISAVKNVQGVSTVQVKVYFKIVSHRVQPGMKPKVNVKNIIAIASGKGGVGKSTTAANLALSLFSEGARVGILDADIYGPSQPMIFGIDDQPKSFDGKTMEPLINHGLQISSIGFIVKKDEPVIWRGPIVTQALQQLLNQTNWHNLDYLIVDMPPGTGDVQLTLSQKVPLTAVIIVSTPQDIALLDATKSINMFKKIGIPILGIIENMSTHICSQCHYVESIFGSHGCEKISCNLGIEFLGKLPLIKAIRVQTDSGAPIVVSDPESEITRMYKCIARKAVAKLAEYPKDMTSKFPNVVIQN